MANAPLVMAADVNNVLGNILNTTKLATYLFWVVKCYGAEDRQKHGEKTHSCDNTSGSDGRALADPNTIQDDRVGAYPYIVFNHDRTALLRAGIPTPTARIGAAGACINADVGADNDIVANAHLASIVDETVARDQDVAAQVDVVAVIAVERRLYCRVVTNAARVSDRRGLRRRQLHTFPWLEDLAEHPGPLNNRNSRGRVGQVVELPARQIAPLALQYELPVKGIIGSSDQHLIPLDSAWPVKLGMRQSELRRRLHGASPGRRRRGDGRRGGGPGRSMQEVDVRQRRALGPWGWSRRRQGGCLLGRWLRL